MIEPKDINGYWLDRKDHDLYKLTVAVGKAMFPNANSIIDIGCYVSPIILYFDWIPLKVALDKQSRLAENWEDVKDVDFVVGDIFQTSFSQSFDLVLSNQTVEHLEDPAGFIEKLLAIGRGLIISTTFELPKGTIEGHIQDPIDLDKFKSLFPVELDSYTICYHPSRKIKHDQVLNFV